MQVFFHVGFVQLKDFIDHRLVDLLVIRQLGKTGIFHDLLLMAKMDFRVGDELVEYLANILSVVGFQPSAMEVIDQAKQFFVLGINEIVADQILCGPG